MKTKVLFKKKYCSKRFEVTQCHWFYFIPTVLFNAEKLGARLIRFQWLFWELDYAWNIKESSSGANDYPKDYTHKAMTLNEVIERCREKLCNNNVCAQDYKQLMDWFIELKQFKSLPSNLDDAAEEYAKDASYGEPDRVFTAALMGFKAGAAWMAGQGSSYEDKVYVISHESAHIGVTSEYLSLDGEGEETALKNGGFKPGDEVIVQIRKK